MIVTIQETVLTFLQAQLDAWKAGDKSLIPSFHPAPDIIANQPAYHFGEAFVLRHFHETEGWFGAFPYAFSQTVCDGSPRHQFGFDLMRTIIPEFQRESIRVIRAARRVRHENSGLPDLFLYRLSGEFRFVEVKKGRDRIRPNQTVSIREILVCLKCPVDIVHLREARERYSPKTHTFDIRAARTS